MNPMEQAKQALYRAADVDEKMGFSEWPPLLRRFADSMPNRPDIDEERMLDAFLQALSENEEAGISTLDGG